MKRALFICGIATLVLVLITTIDFQQNTHLSKSKKLVKEDRIDLAVALEVELTMDLELGYVPKDRLHQANLKTAAIKDDIKRSNVPEIEWKEHGPSNVGGRTRTLIFDKADSTGSTVLAGSASGGIWRGYQIFTAKPIWQNLTPYFSNLSIGSLVQHPDTPNIIYAGTGEGWFNGDAVRGIGIIKSSDGGNSWNRLPSTANSNFRYVQKLVIDTNGDLIACTRNNGVMRSENGGVNWTKILGSGIGGFSDRAADFEISSDGSFYATLGIYSSDGLYKSENNGLTWEFIHGNGMPTENFRRIEVGVAPSNSDVVYAVLEAFDGSCLGIYRSLDAGSNWTSLEIPTSESGLIFGRNQLWYDLAVTVDPQNENHVIIGGVNLFRSTNGGDTWDQLSNWFNTYEHPFVHADQHSILIDPNNPSRALFSNDGGVFMTTTLQIGDPQFNHVVKDYNVTQFYSCTVHPSIRGLIAGGSQDNGSQVIMNENTTDGFKISGGDGAYVHFAGDEGEYLISSFTNNNYNIYQDFDFIGNISFDGGSFINPTTVIGNYFYGNAGDGQYFRVDITGYLEEDLVYVYEFDDNTIRHISVSPNIEKRLYFGFSDGRVLYVDNVDDDYLKNGVEIFNTEGNISCVAVEPGDESHILVTISNYGEVSVWETRNGGGNWQVAENNLPDMPVRWAVFAPGKHHEVLLATETGIWRTDSIRGAWTHWIPESGFPNARTDMIKIQEQTGTIVVGTHGRGFFTTDHYEEFVGIKQKAHNDLDLRISPNPTTNYLNVQTTEPIIGKYSIYSIRGNLVLNGDFDNNPIYLENLPAGTYVIYISNGKYNYSKQFIKF